MGTEQHGRFFCIKLFMNEQIVANTLTGQSAFLDEMGQNVCCSRFFTTDRRSADELAKQLDGLLFICLDINNRRKDRKYFANYAPLFIFYL